MTKIIAAVDESEGSRDAIALAKSLAGLAGAELVLANVYPYDHRPSRAVNPEFERLLRDDSQDMLERVRAEHDLGTAELRAVAGPSPAHGLHELAEQTQAALIVVGSTHTGRAGRVLPGSTAERLFHGSPCPVAVAPAGYAERAPREPGIVGCGYDGMPEAERALAAAHRIAAATGARLRAIRVFAPLVFDAPPGSDAGGGSAYNDTLHDRASSELDAAVARLQGPPRGEPYFSVGEPATELVEASEQLDLLVLGSRGYGPLRAVLVGGVSGRVVREAACPVIVLPRGAGHVEQAPLFPAVAGAA